MSGAAICHVPRNQNRKIAVSRCTIFKLNTFAEALAHRQRPNGPNETPDSVSELPLLTVNADASLRPADWRARFNMLLLL
jgi:hypothetical protein